MFVASTVSILKKMADILKAKESLNMTNNQDFVKNVQQVLSDLIFFVLDIEETDGIDPLKIDEIPPSNK